MTWFALGCLALIGVGWVCRSAARSVRNARRVIDGTIPACQVCGRPSLAEDRLCGRHGGPPISQWPAADLDRLIADTRDGDVR